MEEKVNMAVSTRRGFLGAVAATAAIPAAATSADRVRFLAFADIHYMPGVYPNDSREWLERILARAVSARCEFAIHAGDFTHDPVRNADYVKLYNDAPLPTFHTLGNHDTECCPVEKTLEAYRMERGYYCFDRGCFRFVVLDTNYFRKGDSFVHFQGSNYFDVPRELSWTLGEEQYAWAENAISSSPNPCVVFMHQSCEREQHGMPDWSRLRSLFARLNREKGSKVRLVLNGHHHTDGLRFIDGIPYLDLNSANYKYYHKSHELYPEEYRRTHSGCGHTIAWDAPLSAVLTIGADGYLKVEGSEAGYLFGVSPEMAQLTMRDRPVRPLIQSVEMKISLC